MSRLALARELRRRLPATVARALTGALSSSHRGTALAACALLAAAVAAVAGRWEPSGETWIYWFWARVFAEDRTFVVLDRSPLYTLYLSVFLPLGYPQAVIAEHIVSGFLGACGLYAFTRPYLGSRLSVLAAVIWIPFLHSAEPPAQKLALACTCAAMVIRGTLAGRSRYAISYALLGLAYMFRSTALAFVGLFLVWDVSALVRARGLAGIARVSVPRPRSDWSLALIIALFAWSTVMQSPHPWNNIYGASTTWFPSTSKSFTDGGFLQSFNWPYIQLTYGSFEGRDWYFTNQEVFGGAKDMFQAIRANPSFVVEQVLRNVRSQVRLVAELSNLFGPFARFPLSGVLAALFVLAVAYGAMRACRDTSAILFVGATIVSVGLTVLTVPRTRYLVPMIPVLVLSATWYGSRMRMVLQRLIPATGVAVTPARSRIGQVSVALALLLLAPVTSQWGTLLSDVTSDALQGQLRFLEGRSFSLTAAFPQLDGLVRGCKGVMSREHQFVGAFMDVPLGSVLDIWEIPPFGELDASPYDGLRVSRVDCVLVSQDLVTEIGAATNQRIRYERFLKPYVRKLQDMGARTYEVDRFGAVIVLRMSH